MLHVVTCWLAVNDAETDAMDSEFEQAGKFVCELRIASSSFRRRLSAASPPRRLSTAPSPPRHLFAASSPPLRHPVTSAMPCRRDTLRHTGLPPAHSGAKSERGGSCS